MKSILICLLLFAGVIQAQELVVVKTEQLTFLKDGEFLGSEFSPDGQAILATSTNFKGLYLIDLKSKTAKKISDNAGAGFEPGFSEDGLKIFFRSDEYEGLKKYSSLSQFEVNTNKTNQIEGKCRSLSSPMVVSNQLIYSANGSQKKKQIGDDLQKGQKGELFVRLEDLKPVLYSNGIRKEITPNGDGNYIWASLSPDQTKILYNFQGKTTCVCDLNGKIIADAGRIHAPAWLGNDFIVGMNDKDDGSKVISSEIVTYSLKSNKKSTLKTPSGQIPMYPVVSPKIDKIVYQTAAGELFTMYITIK